jgi:hypothetical protein
MLRRAVYPTAAIRSRVSQIETPLNALDAEIHPVQPIRHVSVLVFKTADALFYLSNIIAHVIDRAPDMTQMLKNNVVGLNHRLKLSQRSIAVNSDP